MDHHLPFKIRQINLCQPATRARLLALTASPVGTKIEIRGRGLKFGVVEERLRKTLESVQKLMAARIVAAPDDEMEQFRKVIAKLGYR